MQDKENKIIENLEEEEAKEMDEASKTALDEVSEALVENVEELEKENEEIADEILEEEVAEVAEEANNAALGKHAQAKLLVEETRSIVQDAENQLDECKLLLASDLKEYENAKQSLKDNGMDASESLLEKLGYESEESVEIDEEMVVFEPKEELEPIKIEEVSSGAFGSFILGLIAAFITVVAMVYVATMKLGVTLDISKVPTEEVLNPLLKWYSSLVGLPGSTTIGTVVIGAVALLVFFIVYKIRVSMKATANLHMAEAQLEAAKAYSVQKGTCKEEMDKVDAYINDAIGTLTLYQVILNEQRGKLERILHLEEDKIESVDFHHKSNIEMQDTQDLITYIKDFIMLPMSEEGKLSGKSSLFLSRAKSKIQKVIVRLY